MMLKNLVFLAVGLAAGLVVMALLRPQPGSPALWRDDALGVDRESLYDAGRSEAEARLAALEERVAQLEAQQRPAGAAAQAPAAAPAPLVRVPPIPREPAPETIARNAPRPDPLTPAMLATFASERELEVLVRAGFTRDRAEWIRRKVDETRMEELRAIYEAQRAGTTWPANGLDTAFVDRRLRAELGEADYERYLRAVGRETRVQVGGVISGSPAASAGVLPGDAIVSYGGTRVFGQQDLNAFILEGAPGESVVVEIERDGQRLQVVVPRGPMGITTGVTLRTLESFGLTGR